MQITINGKTTALEQSLSVADLLSSLGYKDHFVAVAVNSECILRKHYTTHLVQASDEVEILAPMAGG